MQHQQNRSKPSPPNPALIRRLLSRKQFLKWVGFSGMGFILSNWLADGKTVASQSNAQLTFDVKQTSHQMSGFGGQIWMDDEAVALDIAKDQKWSMVRVNIQDKKPAVKNQKKKDRDKLNLPLSNIKNVDFKTHWDSLDAGEMKEFHRQLETRRIIPIYAFLKDEPRWLDSNNKFISNYINEVAEYWAAHVGWMKKNGVSPKYIELFNEPDYKTGGIVSPKDYNEIVKAVRKKLDERGYKDTLIVGPGTAHFDLKPNDPNYIEALDPDGVNAIGAWSLHSYEWGWGGSTDPKWDINSPKYVRNHWKDDQGLLKSINSKDPNHSKPIFLTEHATKSNKYYDSQYDSNDQDKNQNFASKTQSYGVRVFGNALTFINNHVNGVILFQAQDQGWDKTHWGMMSENKFKRPVYYTMQTLSSAVPPGAMVLKSPLQDESDIYAAAFIAGDRFIAAFANGTQTERAVTVTVNNANISFLKAEAVVNGKIVKGKVGRTPNSPSFIVTLPSDSTLVVTFQSSAQTNGNPQKKPLPAKGEPSKPSSPIRGMW